MTTVFFALSVSVDGYIAPAGMTMEHADDPGYRNWADLWNRLQAWVFPQRAFRERLRLGEGGLTGPDNDFVERTFDRTGASVMGRRMFDGGERFWPEEAPFHHPVFVLTHHPRAPWVRPGTTFTFVDGGPVKALQVARAAAGPDLDVRIAGGADTVRQFLDAGLVDEFTLSVAPVMLGGGVRLFDGVDRTLVPVRIAEVAASEQVTHLTYRCGAVRSPSPPSTAPDSGTTTATTR